MKTTARIFAVLLTLLVVAFLMLRDADTDPTIMMAKYGGAQALRAADGYGGLIHYRDQGPHDAVPLLLLHGANSSLHTWQAMEALLKDKYRLISFDQHGHGLTGPHPAGDYSAAARIEAGLKVLDAAGVEKAVWVGNSMGGWVTWRAALAAPDRVSGIVLIDASGVQNDEKQELYLAAYLMRTWFGQQLLPHVSPKTIVRASVEDNYVDADKVSDALVERYWELIRYPGNRSAAVAAINASREPEMWQQVGSIDMPSLILWGEHDKITPLSWAREFRQAIPHSVLKTYPDAGHIPMEELPGKVANDIDQWLEQNLSNLKPGTEIR